MLRIDPSVMAKFPYSVLGKTHEGMWEFVCAMDNVVKAERVAEALRAEGLETRIEDNAIGGVDG